MRHSPTHAEHVLWQILRAKRLGATFRRQHPIGPYITDFICLELNLVVELDGDVHDEARSDYLSTRGLKVIRFRNEEVLEDLDRVVAKIEGLIKANRKSQR